MYAGLGGRPGRARGDTLIEVLIALVLVALGLFGMAALQARGKLAGMESYQRVQALILLDDMADRLTANRPNRACYDLSMNNPPFVGTDATAPATCNAQATADLVAWDALLDGATETRGGANAGAMLGARGCVRRIADNLFEISVVWQGFTPTVVSPNTCASTPPTLYGDAAERRVVSRTIRFAQLQ